MYSDTQAVFDSIAMAMPKGDSLHLMADRCPVNQQLKAVPWPHPNLGQAAELFCLGELI